MGGGIFHLPTLLGGKAGYLPTMPREGAGTGHLPTWSGGGGGVDHLRRGRSFIHLVTEPGVGRGRDGVGRG